MSRNRVSPDPWDDHDYKLAENVKNGDKKPASEQNSGKVKNKEFTYKPRDKQHGGDLNKYFERRFNQKHAWRPYLYERKR